MPNLRVRLIFLFLALTLMQISSWAQSQWEQINNIPEEFVDPNGITRYPSCSGGPILNNSGGELQPANTEFSFFIRRGNPKDLLIALDGGGACWDTNTCIGSALAGDPIYTLEIDETPAALAEIGGIGDIDNDDNPFSDYTQVFIPYCTGDIHWGSKDTTYDFYSDGREIPWEIHHRGFDNLLAVLRWLANYYRSEVGYAPDKVVLAGGSAGGYGVLLALPAVKQILPGKTRTYVLADSANGVISDDFYQKALGGFSMENGVWGVERNVPDFMMGAFRTGPDNLAISTYFSLAWQYPLTRIGQYTRAWDEVQIFYYNVANNVDNPELWSDPAHLIISALGWTLKARTYMHINALASNYRFYIAAGSDHTLLADESFYDEDSGEGIKFSDWTNDMINRRFVWWGNWRNVSCSPSCLQLENPAP